MRVEASMILAMALFATAGAAQPAAPTAPASPPGGTFIGRSVTPAGVLIVGFDANGDARTSREELRLGTARSFGLADGDRNGALTLIELSNWSATWLGDISALPGRFDFDRDGDDRVSAAEFSAELDRRFVRFDADKDGAVGRGELLQLPQARPDRRGDGRQKLPSPPQRQ